MLFVGDCMVVGVEIMRIFVLSCVSLGLSLESMGDLITLGVRISIKDLGLRVLALVLMVLMLAS